MVRQFEWYKVLMLGSVSVPSLWCFVMALTFKVKCGDTFDSAQCRLWLNGDDEIKNGSDEKMVEVVPQQVRGIFRFSAGRFYH
jgi:hypothetical protein